VTTSLFLHFLQASPNLESQTDPCPGRGSPVLHPPLLLADRRSWSTAWKEHAICLQGSSGRFEQRKARQTQPCMFHTTMLQYVADNWPVSM
jgi:hypothetical protein